MKKKVTEKITGQDMELIFCGLEGSYGEVIDVTASFASVDGLILTIKLDDDQFKKLKDVRHGSLVRINFP